MPISYVERGRIGADRFVRMRWFLLRIYAFCYATFSTLGCLFSKRTAVLGVSNLIIVPAAALITVFFALPFWEKLIRAVIYLKLHRPEGGADQSP